MQQLINKFRDSIPELEIFQINGSLEDGEIIGSTEWFWRIGRLQSQGFETPEDCICNLVSWMAQAIQGE